MSRRSPQPDPSLRRQVEVMAAYGIPETDVARTVGIDPKTLRKCYREELDLGTTKANAQVASFLFNSAKNGNVTAQIFWLKTRARWRETPTTLEHTGADGGPLEIIHLLLDDIDARQRNPRMIEHHKTEQEPR